jgi:HK97 family phage prohead protease
MTPERRYLFSDPGRASIEQRDDGTAVIRGYAAVFFRADDPGTEFRMWDDYAERINPGAFDPVLQQDVRGLSNHDPSALLGRSTAGTLRLAIDEHGLSYEIDPPDTQLARDLQTLMKRGDVTGSSFSFTVAQGGSKITTEGKLTVRTITQIDRLFDVGPVTFPAYEGTAAMCRDARSALQEHRRELRRRDDIVTRLVLCEKNMRKIS